MLKGCSSDGMRKLPGKHSLPTEVLFPSIPMPQARVRHGKRPTFCVLYCCVIAAALMLLCASVNYLAFSGGFAKNSRRLYATAEPTAENDVIKKLMDVAAARRLQRWTTSPPATAPRTTETETPTRTIDSTMRSTTDTPADESSSPSPTMPETVKTSGMHSPTPTYHSTDESKNSARLGLINVSEDTPLIPTITAGEQTQQPNIYKGNFLHPQHNGEYSPEEAQRLPGLQIQRRTFTPAELLARFGDTDIVYSFVNGSEVNHEYRKAMVKYCIDTVLLAENASYVMGPTLLVPTPDPAELPSRATASTQGTRSHPLLGSDHCTRAFFKGGLDRIHTVRDFLRAAEAAARSGVDNRDRETDELRHSLRSLEQHVRWHRGRVVVVSPGHHPTWVDGAKNFLAGLCGDARVQALRSSGTHLRVTTVHQDAVMPYGMRLTVDSHVIEQHLWRVRNMTAVHVYMNDDYFVNRDVAITDLFNEYGGTIVRTENGVISAGAVADHSASWAKGVRHTQQFNIRELDVLHEDYLPEALATMWDRLRRVHRGGHAGAEALISVPPLDEAVDVAHQYEPDPLPVTPLLPRRLRRYATHAPFVYCTNMFRFFETRYEREFAAAALRHRSRKARDLFVPFLYNAFIMARPWQASPRFLPYLLELHRSRREARTDAMPPTQIVLDNFDGCGPASLRGGSVASECIFGKFVDNVTANEAVMERVRQTNPLYFNINAGLSTAEAAVQLRSFLHGKFPTPVYLEVGGAPAAGEDLAGGAEEGALSRLFGDLMALPVVCVVSYEEGVCPLVRSLALAFAGHHRGGVRVSVEQHGGATLRETRAALGHGVVSAMPAPACTYGERVRVGPATGGEGISVIARRALDAMGGGVELPATCGGGGAGLRVRGFVVDARTRGVPVRSAAALRDALAAPAQTLSLEDFRAVAVGPSERDVVLVVSREDADAKAVHWVNGASESDLLVTYPLPVEAYEDMGAGVRW
ncbi:hypothetical protein LPMP_160970 [Leishmania panamensis]|uniref:Transmembrane protein n=2 Tax=Leishmania panamensis TaxID=5679 RepID=A0A088S601_LEIPA